MMAVAATNKIGWNLQFAAWPDVYRAAIAGTL